ncbi:MAG: prephenate dehydrogenase [Cyclobacteriaceae bacterium]|nr:prephenate dehydrogenase [Cyclobacteriaceae bacterium]
MKNICIVGLGLLGGSFGLALRKFKPELHHIGVDISEENSKKALELKIVDEVSTLEKALPEADLVVLATPVDVLVKQVPQTLDLIKENAIVLDFGSTKHLICQSVENHSKRSRFIATHPIAGTENSGPGAAFSDLFISKMIILCDVDKTDPDVLSIIKDLFLLMKMRVEIMTSKGHDEHIAFVSHLSHVSSFALGSTVLEIEKNEKNIFIMAGSGFDSTVRLAKSSPDMWTPIFDQNKKNVSRALQLYIEKLTYFKEILDSENSEEIHKFMKETNDIRRVLKNPS